jgi:Tol biopolymer transport system component
MTGRIADRFEMIEKLGEGGMGVVWKARDTRLDRFVALKLLPPEKTSEPECKRRFVQEAKAASALNHPNIITIHDIDHADGADFIAMEIVSGKSLEQLIPRKGLRLREALKYAIQIADALAAAHAAGIVHRDLKPSNVMVTEKGLVKVLDFGLAKLTDQVGGGELARTQTIVSSPETGEGMIVGTVAYMSPEQAQGIKVDARSDIFSFGALFYEMLSGRRAFQSETKMSTLAAILNREPEPIDRIAKDIPREVSRILQRCLRKEPARRAQSMLDLKLALEEIREEAESDTVSATPAAAQTTRRKIWLPALLALVAVSAGAGWFVRGNRTAQKALEAVPLTAYPGYERQSSFSPDGRQVAFNWDGEKQDNYDIYIKLIGSSGRPLRLTTDPAEDEAPAWSPDGALIAFLRHGSGKTRIMLIPALGGAEREVAELLDSTSATFPSAQSASWSPDSRWLAVTGKDAVDKPSAVWLVSTESGEKRQLTRPPTSNLGDYYAALSPDGRTLAFVRGSGFQSGDLYVLPLAGNLDANGEPRRLTKDNGNIVGTAWTADGREIVFSSNRALWRVAASGTGESRILTGGEFPSLSRQGSRLVYSQSITDSNIWRVNLSKPRDPPSQWIASTQYEASPQYSPNGKRITFESGSSGNIGIWVCDADGSNPAQLVAMGVSGSPRWSPDGQRIAFDSNASGIWQIYTVNAGGGRTQRMTKSAANDVRPSWSQDGQWIYFASNRSGAYQVWKMPAAGGEPSQVTRLGGTTAFESKDGKTIYYVKDVPGESPLWKVSVAGGEETQVLESVLNSLFVPTQNGIYFVSRQRLEYFDFSAGISRPISTIEKPTFPGLTISPDSHWLLYPQVDLHGSDLWLVDNFR